MKNIRLTVWIGIMCGWLAAGMLQAGTRPDNARPAEEDGSRLWLPVMRPVEGAEVEVIYKRQLKRGLKKGHFQRSSNKENRNLCCMPVQYVRQQSEPNYYREYGDTSPFISD